MCSPHVYAPAVVLILTEVHVGGAGGGSEGGEGGGLGGGGEGGEGGGEGGSRWHGAHVRLNVIATCVRAC